MNNNNYKSDCKKLLTALPLTVALVACGGTPDRSNGANPDNIPYEVTEDYNSGVILYTVQRGDRLGGIAQEFTGSSSNWRAIAQHNNITNPRSLMEGTVLEIPTNLIPGYQRPTQTSDIQAETNSNTPAVQTPSLAVRSEASTGATPVVVTPINTNRDFQLSPIDENATVEPGTTTSSGTQIVVVGSYYPKGIYTEPAAYSKLIMRVTPGAVFSVDSQVNNWYKIETDSGSGYIRTSDAAVVE